MAYKKTFYPKSRAYASYNSKFYRGRRVQSGYGYSSKQPRKGQFARKYPGQRFNRRRNLGSYARSGYYRNKPLVGNRQSNSEDLEHIAVCPVDESGANIVEQIPIGNTWIRISLLTAQSVVRQETTAKGGTDLDIRVRSEGIHFKGFTEKTTIKASTTRPITHRRIFFATHNVITGCSVKHFEPESGAAFAGRVPGVPSSSALGSEWGKTLFGQGIAPPQWHNSKVATDSVRVIEDKTVTHHPPPGGLAKSFKYWNSIRRRLKYPSGSAKEYVSLDSKSGNIYVADIFDYGFSMDADGFIVMDGVQRTSGVAAYDGKRIKSEAGDGFDRQGGQGTASGDGVHDGVVTLHSSGVLYWYRP